MMLALSGAAGQNEQSRRIAMSDWMHRDAAGWQFVVEILDSQVVSLSISQGKTMPFASTKNPPQDAREQLAAAAMPHFVFRNCEEFASLLQPDLPHGGVFCPTRKKLPEGTLMAIKVRLGRRQPPLSVYGKVAWQRSGRNIERVRAGMAVEFLPGEHAKTEYLVNMARAGDRIRSRRRHERFPIDFQVRWRAGDSGEDLLGRLADIGRGGAFVRSAEKVARDEHVVLEIAPPGAEIPMAFTARIAWRDERAAEPGFGIEWRARDAGGSRRIRELVRRLSGAPAYA
jgi:Tfp pilus assembly protein PilZ